MIRGVKTAQPAKVGITMSQGFMIERVINTVRQK